MKVPWKGFELPTRKVTWLKRDSLLFNLSIGCRADEPQFLYEGNPRFSTFPTYPLGLVFKLNHNEIIDFYGTLVSNIIPGVPKLDPKRLVDGDRTVEINKPLPTSSLGFDFQFRSKVVDVYDKGSSGTVVRSEDCLVDAKSGDQYAKITGSLFYVGQGNWGGPRGPKLEKCVAPQQCPDLVFEIDIGHESAHLYRLNGDYNPLHADPEVGKKLGYGGTINHGVFAFNKIAHGMVRKLGNGDPDSMRKISARFSGPVRPGDTVVVHIWKADSGIDGLEDLQWLAQWQVLEGTVSVMEWQ